MNSKYLMNVCSNCGKEVPNANYCCECGTLNNRKYKEYKQVECKKCSKLVPYSNYCASCGFKLP